MRCWWISRLRSSPGEKSTIEPPRECGPRSRRKENKKKDADVSDKSRFCNFLTRRGLLEEYSTCILEELGRSGVLKEQREQ